MFCREHVAQLREHEAALAGSGAMVAAVGTGGIDYARAFKDDHELPYTLLVDSDLHSYRALGARRGAMRELASLRTVKAGLRALRRGNLQGRPGNHPLMLGATHVVLPGGAVPFAWLNDDFGDNAPVPEVLEALP